MRAVTTIGEPMAAEVDDPNVAAFCALRRALEEKRLIAMIGAGVSVRASYPSWDRLLKIMHDTAASTATWDRETSWILQNHRDPLWRAEEYRLALGEEAYRELLRAEFRPKQPRGDALLGALAKLPFEPFEHYGAFTVGVEADGGRTRLEIDLAGLEDAPQAFRDA